MGGVRWLEYVFVWGGQGYVLGWAFRTLRPRMKAWVMRALVRR